MAMHSLKKPGAEDRVQLKFGEDPLSFLLMICDEIQVWNRERPDMKLQGACFRTCDLTSLTFNEDSIQATVTFVRSRRFSGDEDSAITQIRTKILEDDKILRNYVVAAPLKVTVEFLADTYQEPLGTIQLE